MTPDGRFVASVFALAGQEQHERAGEVFLGIAPVLPPERVTDDSAAVPALAWRGTCTV
jgi:hypothetical protein